MMHRLFILNEIFLRTTSQTVMNYRFVRTPRVSDGPKFIKPKIKTFKEDLEIDEYKANRSTDYKNFSKRLKSSYQNKITDDDIDEAFAADEDFEESGIFKKFEESDPQYKNDDADRRSKIKFKIISRKYFKLDVETCLLTHAAKEQIRYLSEIDPEGWTPEIISQSFPITPNGVKKLLKSPQIQKSDEQIRKHDEEIAKRWELLESGKRSPKISLYTQRMWDEGKIIKEHFNGNLNLPKAPTKIVIKKEKKPVGEYSSIIQQYVKYKEEKESMKEKESLSAELQVKDEFQKKTQKNTECEASAFFNDNNYHIDDETDDSRNQTGFKKSLKISDLTEEPDLPYTQFKLNLTEEIKFDKSDQKYKEWVQHHSEKKTKPTPSIPINTKELFTKIPKYNMEYQKQNNNAFLYDEKQRYHNVKQKPFKARIKVPTNLQKKGTTYKVGQCIYDENGEFLYKLPL